MLGNTVVLNFQHVFTSTSKEQQGSQSGVLTTIATKIPPHRMFRPAFSAANECSTTAFSKESGLQYYRSPLFTFESDKFPWQGEIHPIELSVDFLATLIFLDKVSYPFL